MQMNLRTETKKSLLIKRIEDNYGSFLATLYGVSREKLIGMAERIAVVNEAREMLTKQYDWNDEGEIDFYLMFRDPLTIVSDALESRIKEMSDNFDDAMCEVANSDNIISEYPLMDGVDRELCGKLLCI
jgi:hypothetical protein